jgi:hypothetical protein
VASGAASALVRMAVGGKVAAQTVMGDVFGNALGNSITGYMQAGIERRREEADSAERFLQSYNEQHPELPEALFADLDLNPQFDASGARPLSGDEERAAQRAADRSSSLPELYEKYFGLRLVKAGYDPDGAAANGDVPEDIQFEPVPEGIMTDEGRAVAGRNMQRVLSAEHRDLTDLFGATQTFGMMKAWITDNQDTFAHAFSEDLTIPELIYIGGQVPAENLVNPEGLTAAQTARAHELYGDDPEAAYRYANYRNRAAIVNRMSSEVALQSLGATWGVVRDLNPVLAIYERGHRYLTAKDAWTDEDHNPYVAMAELGFMAFAPKIVDAATGGRLSRLLARDNAPGSGLSTGLGSFRGSTLDDALTGSGLQRHHINESAAFGDVIPRDDGLIVPLEGNAIGTAHYKFHEAMRAFWRPYQKGGERYGSFPTNGQVGEAQTGAFLHAGYTPAEAKYLAAAARGERLIYGLKDSAPVPNIPKKGR